MLQNFTAGFNGVLRDLLARLQSGRQFPIHLRRYLPATKNIPARGAEQCYGKTHQSRARPPYPSWRFAFACRLATEV
jgi:hypothetical protein